MKTITLSDMDAQIIVDALRFKTAVLINELLSKVEEAPTSVTPTPVAARYGLKKDGTPRKPPGRPRK